MASAISKGGYIPFKAKKNIIAPAPIMARYIHESGKISAKERESAIERAI